MNETRFSLFSHRIRKVPLYAVVIAIFSGSAMADVKNCKARDFLSLTLSNLPESPEVQSVLAAYEGIRYNAPNKLLIDENGAELLLEDGTDRTAKEILLAPTFGDQFRYIYPLSFDLEKRKTAWVDPGRVRNEDFMQFLFHDNEIDVRNSLLSVGSQRHDVEFQVTQKHGVACQLQAALDAISTKNTKVFRDVGGSFNWRLISGTKRLSVHSYGAAIDLNANLGGYWKWSGRSAGNVGDYKNNIPQDVVQIFEKYGFIWGGKWHHFDGMHFEYRPELILYARMVGNQ